MANLTTAQAPEVAPKPESRDSIQFRIARRKLIENSITVLAFLVVFGAFGFWTGGRFLDVDGRLLDVHSAVPILMLGLAALVTLITGQFDLSVAGVATTSTFAVIGLTVNQNWPFFAVVLFALGVGLVVGLVNGFLVEWLKVNAFIATFATGATCAGLASVYSKGTYIGPGPTGPQLPGWFVSFGSQIAKPPSWVVWIAVVVAFVTLFLSLDRMRPPSWMRTPWMVAKVVVMVAVAALLLFVLHLREWVDGVSWMVFSLLVIGLLLGILLRYTTYGRHIQAIGSNRSAALLAGVKVRRQVMKTFVLGGLIAAIAGIALAAGQGSATPDAAAAFLLPAFSAAFLSTVVLSDGKFTVAGTILGGVFVTWVGLGLVVGGINPLWVNVVNGVVLIGAVALSTALRARR
jgi:ribose/xylose/arabinose/galactoside ABC-type transport system permease subunit